MRFYCVVSYIIPVRQPPTSPLYLQPYKKYPDHHMDLDSGLKLGKIHYILPFTS